MATQTVGSLYLIPIPISEGKANTLPDEVIQKIHSLRYFVAENARTARRFISSTNPPYALPDVSVEQFGKHDDIEPATILKPVMDGHDIGVMSEAGCPGIADPGARLAGWCHRHGIRVIPMTGPSSLILALMASGLNGQKFTFHGYLPRDKKELAHALKSLERESANDKGAQLWIEAPYRNRAMIEALFSSLNTSTRVTIASDITGDAEFIRTAKAGEWPKIQLPDMHKVPAVFILQA